MTTTAEYLASFRSAGHSFRAGDDGKLLVTNAERLTSEEREWVKANKADILALLAMESLAGTMCPPLDVIVLDCGCHRHEGRLVAVCAGCAEAAHRDIEAYHQSNRERAAKKAKAKAKANEPHAAPDLFTATDRALNRAALRDRKRG